MILGEEARIRQLSLIPVTGLKRNNDYQSAVASVAAMNRRGVCIRVLLDDIQRVSFQNDLELLLSYLKLQPEQIDLLIDYQIISDFSPGFASVCARFPYLLRWRTFTIASGAFPKDLSELEKNSQHVLQRLDWLTWLGQVTNETTLPRKPSYSDYTIQHPIFSEPPEFPNFSASIRYTSNEYWVIMRGEGVFNDNGPGYAQ